MKRLLFLLAAVAVGLPFAYATASGGSAAKVAICHRTASGKTPYVKLRVSRAALKAHVKHAPDIIPAPRGRCPTTVLRPTAGGRAFSVGLTGEAEAPAGDPVATGTATFRLRAGQGQVCFTMRIENLASPAAAAHIHSGAAGVAGPVVVPLTTPNSAGSSSGCVVAARKVVAQILASPGNFYANVHTSELPAGAVRGQLAGTTEAALGRTFVRQLSGSAEPSGGDPDGTGTAVIRVRRDDGQLCFRLTVQNIDLPSVGAHIHRGAAGVNGPIVIPLTAPGTSGASSGCTAADKALLDEILASPAGFYVNVHTRPSPGGAVRAQLA